ncbi:non-muscle caldesmon isoform X2 [Kryptolebias marmoratus]|uniref:non-muscle caldesmon isoform X2 n=1 Tax=Kryptolebias marmoratus TaxID=37003 RepID=UPI0007F8F216|nr:non-muscle caldesmon isoform X2 [Kryptolebias marmoratus]
MSESIKRRNSSKQLLQNLIRVTVQRSQEDAEEVERERRRRAREKQKGEGILCCSEPHRHNNVPHNTESDEELKPSCSVMEEDEGFSDWSHRLENRNEREVQEVCRAKGRKPSAPSGPEEKKQQKDEEEHEGRTSDEDSTHCPEKTSSTQNTSRPSYSPCVFVSQDSRLQPSAGQAPDRTTYLAAGTMKPRGGACRMDGEVEQRIKGEEEEEVEEELKPTLQREPAETRQSSGDEDEREEEELSFMKEEKKDLYIMREERDGRGEEKEEEEQSKSSAEDRRRRSEEVNSRSSGSLVSTSEGEESLNCYGPMSPTFKKLLIQFYPEEANSRVSADGKCTITERTESLRRSSNTKKTQLPVPVSKIDKRLEQYTHALEVSSKDGKPSCQALTDLVSPSEPVTSKKNLFEAGEAWNQNILSVPPSKDADGIKVGVADLINQWVKGGEDGSRSNSPSKPAEIRPGGVLNKKNLWENLGDTLSSTRDGKENTTKRYKYVVAGHGKYTKVSVDNGCNEDVSCQAAGQFCEDL